MIYHSSAQIDYNQQQLVELIMNITTPAARSGLAELGFKLAHMMVLDGFPQHFPTNTSGWDYTPHHNQQEFLDVHGYEGWRPELGSTCRGPLPLNSMLTNINHLERQHFSNQGFDMSRWYGKTWEFTNQLWWGMAMWGNNQLDCTHFGEGAGGPFIMKYFLQAMLDGYYDEEQHKQH